LLARDPRRMKHLTPALLTDPRIKHLAGIALANPAKLSLHEIQELAASVLAHIEPHRHPLDPDDPARPPAAQD
jgi:hypothetical protein